MKRHIRSYPFVLAVLLATACAQPELEGPKKIAETYQTREREIFTAWDFAGEKRYALNAVHLAENDACVIYGEESALVSLEIAEKIAREFQDVIYPKITGVFGFPLDVDGNGKLTILLLNIRDTSNTGNSYLAGYFDPINMYRPQPDPGDPGSNARDMLYMDTDPGRPGEASFYTTIAHELQHLINFSVTLKNRAEQNTGRTSAQDTWIDEGLSSAAEYVYNGRHILSRINHFNAAGGALIRGNNFFIWTEDENVLDEYATVYLFFQWLRIQAADSADPYSIYRDIINSPYADYRAVLEPAARRISAEFTGWETLLKTWLLANYVTSTWEPPVNPLLTYRGEIMTRVKALGGENLINLRPGEGVYSLLDNKDVFFPPTGAAASPHIRYVGVTGKGELRESFEGLQGKEYRLLTLNVNEDKTAGAEPGKLTGRGNTVAREAVRRVYAGEPIPLDGSSRLPGWKAPPSGPSLTEPGGRD
jgi:hypothetical protein